MHTNKWENKSVSIWLNLIRTESQYTIDNQYGWGYKQQEMTYVRLKFITIRLKSSSIRDESSQMNGFSELLLHSSEKTTSKKHTITFFTNS